MAIDTSLPISNKGTNGSPITDSGGNLVQGAEVTLWRRVLSDTNSDGEGDEITDTQLLARTQTDSNGEYEFTEDDVPTTYVQGTSEVIYYCTVHAVRVEAGSGDPLDNGRIKAYSSDNEPAASDYMTAYSLASSLVSGGLIHYYNPKKITASTGTGVSTFPDAGSSPEDLSGGTPTLENVGDSVAPVYDATDDILSASSKTPWQFLHDGSEFELFIVAQPRTTISDEFSVVAGTMTNTSSEVGFVIGFDDRSGSGFDNHLRVSIGNGGGGGVVVYSHDEGNILTFGDNHIINIRYDGANYTVEHNETQLDSGSANLSHATGNPTAEYAHGKKAGGSTDNFGGAIGDNAIYDRVLTSSERSDNYNILANKYGVIL